MDGGAKAAASCFAAERVLSLWLLTPIKSTATQIYRLSHLQHLRAATPALVYRRDPNRTKTASRSHVLFALWAVVILATTMQASGSRALLQSDPLGLQPCSLEASAAGKAANCPHDGLLYQVCLLGPATGGCRLESAGMFPEAECNTICSFQSN
ncbi:hypothetical protein WJX75_009162 [Coccomyxa subellipsoidea]|uniref:Uncharacterized protein n=1 Tax=Coccomyxa subellipsoidea TaxID=248742 RepID=A0ABR2Z1U2_9CHLO